MAEPKRNRLRARPFALVLALATVLAGCGAEQYPQTIFEPVTEIARTINGLQETIFWWTMLVLAIVVVALLLILVRFRARPGAAEPKRIHGNNTLEILWTLGPAIIVALILVPTVRTIFDTYQPAAEDALHVHAIGHQWWWEFRYPELGITTANQMHLPVGRPVQVTLSSADVLHNFWFPRLHGKRYTYPDPRGAESERRENFSTLVFTVEEPGVYSGQCAEFCGTSHALMRMSAVAVSEDEFEEWVRAMKVPGVPGASAPPVAAPGQPEAATVGAERAGAEEAVAAAGQVAEPPPGQEVEPVAAEQVEPSIAGVDPLVAEGYELFRTRPCVACHAVEGVSQGQLGPSLTRMGERWSIGAGVLDNTQANMEAWIRDPQAVKPEAKMPGADTPGGGMPATGLTDEQVRAIAAYLSSLK